MTRTKKAIKNSVFSILQQIINIVVNIILPPIIISNFGSVINGLIATIKEIMGYVRLVGAGLSSSSVESLYKPLSEKNKSKINGYINAINKSFNSVGIIFSIIVVILSCIYPYILNEVSIQYSTVTFLVLIIGITGASEFFIIGKYRTLLTADQKIFVVSITQIVGNILNLVVTIILIKFTKNILIIQFVASVMYSLRIFILYFYVKSNYKYLDNKVLPLNEAVSKRKDALFHQISGTIVSGSTTIIISIFCGLDSASIYSVYALIFLGVNSLCAIFSNSLVPSFGEVVAKGDSNTLSRAFNIYEYIYYIIIFIFYAVASVTILPFVSIYTKNADINYINSNIAILFIIIGVIANIKVPFNTIIVAHGHFKETKIMAIIETIINLSGQLVFVYFLGLEGILLGTILSYLYRTIHSIIYVNKNILNISNIIVIKRIIINLLITFVPVYFISKIINFNSNSYLEWGLKAIVLSIIILFISLVINYVIDKSSMNEVKFRIKRIFK